MRVSHISAGQYIHVAGSVPNHEIEAWVYRINRFLDVMHPYKPVKLAAFDIGSGATKLDVALVDQSATPWKIVGDLLYSEQVSLRTSWNMICCDLPFWNLQHGICNVSLCDFATCTARDVSLSSSRTIHFFELYFRGTGAHCKSRRFL